LGGDRNTELIGRGYFECGVLWWYVKKYKGIYIPLLHHSGSLTRQARPQGPRLLRESKNKGRKEKIYPSSIFHFLLITQK